MTSTPTTGVVLGHRASEVRRAVGPVAWACLEAIVANAHGTDDGVIAAVSVRTLAAELDVAKDTAARAVLVLRRAGLITPMQLRASGGAFARGRYALEVPAEVLAPAHRERVVARVRPVGHPVEQLALLPR